MEYRLTPKNYQLYRGTIHMGLNLIRRIKIENIKGKSRFELFFADFTANHPNIIVAPNGYGKSTLATALKAAEHGKMKLDIQDIYQQNRNNHPTLEIELSGDNVGLFRASDTQNTISSSISLGVINSPLYAKSITRSYGSGRVSSADLRIEDIIVCKSVPPRASISYSYAEIKSSFSGVGKLFLNISELLSNYHNIELIFNIREILNKCIAQERIQHSFDEFLRRCPTNGTVEEIKSQISLDEITTLQNNSNISILFDCINKMANLPPKWHPIDVIFTAIQLCKVIGSHYSNGEKDIIKKVHTYLEYKTIRETIDKRLEDFNTTGRVIKTREDHGKLIVTFDRADSLSNGERDILSFVVNIEKFEFLFKKTIGILVIDEVFDYLDGSNMLAVQYYLTELIKRCKAKGKVFFPLIFTHLDPAVFSNYYFQKKKVHYISASGQIDMTADIVKMLRVRESNALAAEEKEEIEKYYLHYTGENHTLSSELANKIDPNFSDSNASFRAKLYDEVTGKYLNQSTYNPVMVIAGLRIKIEEIIYHQLNSEDRLSYIEQHKVINKLNFAIERGINIPELYFLLQPLYNDGLHLGGSEEAVRSKIRSSYLKTDNLHIRKMIEKIFS